MRTLRNRKRPPRGPSGSCAQRARGCRGQSLVELALTFPVILVLMAGVVDLAHAFSLSGICANAAREGARYGATDPTNTSAIKDRVIQEAAGAPLTLARRQVTVSTPGGTTSGNPITVEVTYPVGALLAQALGFPQPTIVQHATMAIF